MREYRVFGPPGTGKTTFLSKQIYTFLTRDGYPPQSIYVSSFTRAAAREIASRDLIIPEKNIGTLHALCFRILGNPTIAETKTADFDDWVPDKFFQFNQSIDVDVDNPFEEHQTAKTTKGKHYLNEINVLRNRLIHSSEWELGQQKFFSLWKQWKELNGYVDFCDLIEVVLDQESELDGCSVFIVDEAQDLTPLHWKLSRFWGEKSEHFLVAGDDDQSIYGWAGANVSKFLEGVTEENSKVLSQSHRIPKQIHELSQSWIKGVVERKQKDFRPMESDGEINYIHSTYKEILPEVVRRIESLIDGGDTCMFLASSHQFLDVAIEVFRMNGIAFHNPYRKNNGAWNPLQRKKKSIHSADRLYSFLKPDRTVQDLKNWTETIYKKCYDHTLLESMTDRPKDEIISDEELDWIFGDYSESFATQDTTKLAQCLTAKWSAGFRFPLRVFERRREMDDLVKPPKMIIGTIHSVKGGEADHVFLVPDLPIPSFADWRRGNRDEIIRVFYVAFTRARKSLNILKPHNSGMAIPTL